MAMHLKPEQLQPVSAFRGVHFKFPTGRPILFRFGGRAGGRAGRRIERINFAERNRPRWIKLSKQGVQVIFENTGNESSHKYLSYGKNGV